jgi:predicted Mrr-cat superfamily restriction endonuclease
MRAFVLRMNPAGQDWVQTALEQNQISIGWGLAQELMDESLDRWAFREVVKKHYYANATGYQKAGAVAGMLWLFLREMNIGDLVVVPSGDQSFHVAEVQGGPIYLSEKIQEHTAFRRGVRWLNGHRPLQRRTARARLQSRMKIRQTCGDASDLVDDIRDALEAAASSGGDSGPRTFGADLRARLIDQAKAEMHSGRMDSYGFENLVATLLKSLGATDTRIVGRSIDKGADIVASFLLADTFLVRVAVQAKHFRPEPPVGPDIVDQLVLGMDAEQVTMGWIATSGTFSPDAQARKAELEDERAISIQLVDGDQLAAMIVEGGLRAVGYVRQEHD